jgi:lysophospholipase L1-like esterase
MISMSISLLHLSLRYDKRRAWRSLLLCLAIIGIVAMLPATATLHAQDDSKFASAADPAIYYYGRVQVSDKVLWTWPGTGFRVAYSGTPKLALKFFAENTEELPSKGTPRAFVYRIDNGKWQRVVVGSGSDNYYALNVPGDSNTHVLEVVKTVEGRLIFEGFQFGPFGTLQATGSGRSRKIEFVGDSITAGFRIFGMGSYDIAEHADAKSSYAWIAGDRLGAEVRLIAITGRGIVHNFGVSPQDSRTMPQYYPYLNRESGDGNNWAAWQPDIVVINLGTNDLTPPFDSDPGQFQSNYAALLEMVRNYNPGAVIVALDPFGINYGRRRVYTEQIQAAVKFRRDAGDDRVTFLSTKGWLGRGSFIDGTHLTASGQASAGSILASHLRRLGGAAVPAAVSDQETAPTPPSVVSNGSSDSANNNSTNNSGVVGVNCPGAPATRLAVGMKARVIVDGRGASPLRDTPGGKLIAFVPEGTILKVFDGPRCFVRGLYWLVYLPDNRAGWINEGDRVAYAIEPVTD